MLFRSAYAVIEGTPSDAKLHLRGDPEKPGEVIPRRWIEVLGGQQLSNPSASGRQELSNWIVEHPLFARVIVNRVWHWHFGQGLVATPNDFGSRGSPPSHPELLGQLASQFVASGYSVKQLHRWIINTRAYQRSSTASQEQLIADPENRYLSHFTRRRLSAEEIRDSILMVTGSLDRTIGEGHPFPSEATWTFSQHDPFNAIYDHKKRSAMLMVQRQRRHPFLALFDGADPNASTPVRQSTTVPTQALYYLNDSFFHEQAAVLSQSLLATSNDAERLRMVFEAILQRKPKGSEDVDLLEFIHRYPGGAVEGWSAAIRILMASNEFNYVE